MSGPGPLGLIGRSGPIRTATGNLVRPPYARGLQPRRTWTHSAGPLKGPWPGARWVSTTVTTVASFSATHVYQLPTLAVGDRITLVASYLGSLAEFTATTDLSAWTSFLASELNAFHCWRGYTLYVADAAAVTAWSGATVTFNGANGGKSTAVAVRVENGADGAIDVAWDHSGPSATASTNQPDPPELVPGWGEDHNLWLAFATFGSGGDSAQSQPQDYHDLAQGGAAADQTTTAVAVRYTIAGGENPGAFILTGTENNQALTFGIRPLQPAVVDDRAGAARMALGVVGRSSGTKGSAGAARVATAAVGRASGSKGVAGSARALAAIVGRTLESKGVAGAARAALGGVGRVTPGKVASGGARIAAGVTGRPGATKVALGGARVSAGVVLRSSGTKAAVAAARLTFSGVGWAAGSASGAVAGAARAAFGVIGRVAGTKGSSSAARASGGVIGRAGGAKSATGAARSSTPVTGRAGATKAATGGARAGLAVGNRTSGSRSAVGAARAVLGVLVRAGATKGVAGVARLALGVLGRVERTPLEPVVVSTVAHRASLEPGHAAILWPDDGATEADAQAAMLIDPHQVALGSVHGATLRVGFE